MTFTDAQRWLLATPLDPKLVKVKPVPGSPKYIPGYVAMEAANSIFGAENWGYVVDRVTSADLPGGALYTAYVTVTVGGCHPKQDVGCEIASTTREGKPPSAQAHETAIKGAVTDGVKRALRTYGDPFGLQLYDRDVNLAADYAEWQRAQVTDSGESEAEQAGEKPKKTKVDYMRIWLASAGPAVDRFFMTGGVPTLDEVGRYRTWIEKAQKLLPDVDQTRVATIEPQEVVNVLHVFRMAMQNALSGQGGQG